MAPPSLSSKRLEFEDAVDAMERYVDLGWTDGLPIVPPTVEAVRRSLDAAGRAPSEILGADPVKGRVVTAEKAAINAVMAGCRPEYLPVVLAAVEAICEPEFNLHAVSASTMGAAVMLVVGGPVADRLGINSGVNAFGPGSRPNATIGRAVRLVMMNAVGAAPGELDKATLGHPGKYAWCFAEAERARPWEELHVQRGLRPEQSAVTAFAGLSPVQVSNHEARSPEGIFASFVDAMFTAGPGQEEIVAVLCPEHMGYVRAAGWSRRDVQEHLYRAARRTASAWARMGVAVGDDDPDAMVGVARAPESVTPIVAGGAAGAFSSVVALWGGGGNSRSVTKEVRTP